MSFYANRQTRDELEIDLEKKLILIRAKGTKGDPITFNSHKMIDFTKKQAASSIKQLKRFREEVSEQISSLDLKENIKKQDESILLNETIAFLTRKAGKMLFLEEVPTFTKESHYKVDIPLEYLKQTLERYSEDDLDLNPDFQRGHVWTKQQQITFLEYVLKEGKVNPIYFNHPNWMNFSEAEKVDFVIVDGKQRLKAAVDFLDEKFRIFKDLDKEGKGFFYSEITRIPSTISFRFEINTLKTKKEVLQWYLDLNTGGTQHKKSELDKVRILLEKEV